MLDPTSETRFLRVRRLLRRRSHQFGLRWIFLGTVVFGLFALLVRLRGPASLNFVCWLAALLTVIAALIAASSYWRLRGVLAGGLGGLAACMVLTAYAAMLKGDRLCDLDQPLHFAAWRVVTWEDVGLRYLQWLSIYTTSALLGASIGGVAMFLDRRNRRPQLTHFLPPQEERANSKDSIA